MSNRTKIMLLSAGAVLITSYAENLAAAVAAMAWGGTALHLHVIEVKLNKLLDRAGVTVTAADIMRDRD
jgi:hypothetical protein